MPPLPPISTAERLPADTPCRSAPLLPRPRGPVSAQIISALRTDPGTPRALPRVDCIGDATADDDLHLALYVCYELHYRGFGGVDPRWEWAPALLALRGLLETRFEEALQEATARSPVRHPADLEALASVPLGPSLSAYMASRGTVDQMRELCVHRSAYQLKEADPHTWVLPRLGPGSKAATSRIQHDEYGGGRAEEVHSALFARTMRALGLDDAYGAYLDLVPGVTLATVNLISMLGLHRRHRARLIGHLALFEMTSVGPMSRYGQALRRLGFGSEATGFYDAHVVADEEHARIALDEMVASLLAEEPGSEQDVLEGARWLSLVEARFADHVLSRWRGGSTSLVEPAPNPSITSAGH